MKLTTLMFFTSCPIQQKCNLPVLNMLFFVCHTPTKSSLEILLNSTHFKDFKKIADHLISFKSKILVPISKLQMKWTYGWQNGYKRNVWNWQELVSKSEELLKPKPVKDVNRKWELFYPRDTHKQVHNVTCRRIFLEVILYFLEVASNLDINQ